MDANFAIYRAEYKAIEVKDGRTHFFSKMLESRMRLLGIPVPADLYEIFNQESYIGPENPLFNKALYEIYYPMYLKKQGYSLKTVEKVSQFTLDRGLPEGLSGLPK